MALKERIKISDDKADPVTGLTCSLCRLPISLLHSTRGTVIAGWRNDSEYNEVPHPITGEPIPQIVERRLPVYKGVRVCEACKPSLLAICPSCKGLNESHTSCRHCGERFAYPSFGSPERQATTKEAIPTGNGRSRIHSVPVAMANVFADYNNAPLSGGTRIVRGTEVRRRDLSRAFRSGKYLVRGKSGKVKVIVRNGNVIDQATGRIARDEQGRKVKANPQ